MFEISIFFLIWYRVRCGGVGLASWMACRCGLLKGMEQGREREGGRREIDSVCVAVCAVTVDMELANEAVCLGRTRQSQEHPTPDHISSHTMVVLADVTVRTGRSPVGKQNSLRLFCVRKEICREWREPGTPAAFARLSSNRGGSLTFFLRFSFKHFYPLLRWVSTSSLLDIFQIF